MKKNVSKFINKIENTPDRTMACHLMNFSNRTFRNSQKINSSTATRTDSFKSIKSYGPRDLSIGWYRKHRSIMKYDRGYGYWVWKPYLILRRLNELNFGEYLFYCDSGSHFIKPISFILETVDKTQDVIPFELPYLEQEFTKRDAFHLMNMDSENFANSQQRLSGYILFKKTQQTIEFLEEWYSYNQDFNIVSDADNICGKPNYKQFKAHRHDQSIFSLLTKKYNFTAYRDPSQYGNEYKEYYPNSPYPQIIVSDRQKNLPDYYSKIERLARRLLTRF